MAGQSPSDPTIANSTVKISSTHQFSKAQSSEFEKAVRDHAATLAAVKKGPSRSALFPAHTDQILAQFKDAWEFQTASQKWTNTSIRKVLSGYIHELNKPKGLTAAIKSNGVNKKKPVKISPLHRPTRQFTVAATDAGEDTVAASLATAESYSFPPQLRSPSLVVESTESIITPSPPASSQLEMRGSGSTGFTTPELATRRALLDLASVILVVKPSVSDPWKRKLLSFPLWRCQRAVDGRDAAAEDLKDWRDLSFIDFVRQLRGEGAMRDGEVIKWGEYDQVVTSDMTFSGAVQEQLQEARSRGDNFNEVTFMVASRQSPPE